MSLVFKDNHVEEGLGYLLEQFKNRPRLEALLTATLNQVQAIEDSASGLYSLRDLDGATGNNLDLLGRIIGWERDGLTDDVYRLYLRAIVLANRSSGTAEEILQVTRLITNSLQPLADIHIREFQPAKFRLYIGESIGTTDPAIILTIVGLAKAAGVGMLIEYATTEEPFVFEGGVGLGFGDLDDPAVGGAFVGVIV